MDIDNPSGEEINRKRKVTDWNMPGPHIINSLTADISLTHYYFRHLDILHFYVNEWRIFLLIFGNWKYVSMYVKQHFNIYTRD